MISGIPFAGPIGAVRLAHHDGTWIPHPTYQEGDASTFELIVAGRRLPDGDVAVMMVEAGGTEAAWELYQAGAPHMTEEIITEGLEEAKKWINDSITAQLELVDAWVADRGPISRSPTRSRSTTRKRRTRRSTPRPGKRSRRRCPSPTSPSATPGSTPSTPRSSHPWPAPPTSRASSRPRR